MFAKNAVKNAGKNNGKNTERRSDLVASFNDGGCQEGWPRNTSGLKDKEIRSQREQLQKAVKTKSIGDYGYLHNGKRKEEQSWRIRGQPDRE